jgi:ATP-dependent DNA helicase DinG
LFGPDKTCITTSATLGTGDDQLSYFRERIGAQHVPAVKIGSPFDYQKQMAIYVMKSMPDPRDDDYEKMLIHWIERVVKKSEGRAFVLFTSHRPFTISGGKYGGFFRRQRLDSSCAGNG